MGRLLFCHYALSQLREIPLLSNLWQVDTMWRNHQRTDDIFWDIGKFKPLSSSFEKCFVLVVVFVFLSDPSPIIGYACQWLPNWLLFSKLDRCDPGVWRCQLKTDDEDHVSNSLLQIWELMFGPSDFEHKGWSRFWSWRSARFWNWNLFSILPLMFCRGYEVESWSIFWS